MRSLKRQAPESVLIWVICVEKKTSKHLNAKVSYTTDHTDQHRFWVSMAQYFRLLPFAFCLLPFAFYLLPFAFRLLPFAFCLLPFAFCLLPFAFCLLNFAFIPPVPHKIDGALPGGIAF
ncbi:MAG: hypothetical protein R6V49_09050, partial [Bacteroidales bacterium]